MARYGPLYPDVHILLLASLPATVLPLQPSYRPKADCPDREMLAEDVREDREEATEEEDGAEVDEEQSDDSLEGILKGGHCGVELRAEQTSRLERDLRYRTSQACLSRRIGLARLGRGRSELLRVWFELAVRQPPPTCVAETDGQDVPFQTQEAACNRVRPREDVSADGILVCDLEDSLGGSKIWRARCHGLISTTSSVGSAQRACFCPGNPVPPNSLSSSDSDSDPDIRTSPFSRPLVSPPSNMLSQPASSSSPGTLPSGPPLSARPTAESHPKFFGWLSSLSRATGLGLSASSSLESSGGEGSGGKSMPQLLQDEKDWNKCEGWKQYLMQWGTFLSRLLCPRSNAD